jgi:hypothetical protein
MAGKVWEVAQSYGTVLLIRCDWAPRLHRRVLLAVDRSDSTSGATDSLQSVVTELARTLDPGDIVALWVMGEAAPLQEFEIRNESARRDMAQLICSLRESPRGTWLRETWSGMRTVSARPKPGFSDFLMVISDGEVFDAGSSDPQPPGSPLRWLRLRGGAGEPTNDFKEMVAEAPAISLSRCDSTASRAIHRRLTRGAIRRGRQVAG